MSKNENAKSYKKAGGEVTRRMSYGAVVLGVLVFLTGLAAIMDRNVSIAGHVVVISAGLAMSAILFGSLVWAFVEMFTKPGEKIFDLVWRFIFAYLVGGTIGALFAYAFNFGGYVIEPAIAGNPLAIYEILSILFLLAVFIADAVWMHKRSYLKRSMGA